MLFLTEMFHTAFVALSVHPEHHIRVNGGVVKILELALPYVAAAVSPACESKYFLIRVLLDESLLDDDYDLYDVANELIGIIARPDP